MWISIALISLTAPLQEAPSDSQEPLAMHYFTPDEEHLSELYEQARDLFRRSVPRPSGNARDGTTDNLFLLGDSIVVYDTAAYADAVLSGLEGMQNAWRKQEPAPDNAPVAQLASDELRVAHLSAFEAYQALEQLNRHVTTPDGDVVPNVQLIEDRGLILLRDTLERVKQMRALVERIDRPAPQIQLSFLVLDAYSVGEAGSEHDPRIPAVLTAALGEMLPGMILQLASSAMLRTVAKDGVQRQIFMPIEGQGRHFELSFRLGTFDERAGVLDLRECSLSESTIGGPPRPHFTTGTAIPLGEYVVIGANGASPTLLVVRAVRADGKAAGQTGKQSRDFTR